jgi:hypothetical protein
LKVGWIQRARSKGVYEIISYLQMVSLLRARKSARIQGKIGQNSVKLFFLALFAVLAPFFPILRWSREGAFPVNVHGNSILKALIWQGL